VNFGELIVDEEFEGCGTYTIDRLIACVPEGAIQTLRTAPRPSAARAGMSTFLGPSGGTPRHPAAAAY